MTFWSSGETMGAGGRISGIFVISANACQLYASVVKAEPRRIKSFESESAFEAWLSAHHDSEPEVWIKIHKKSSGLPSVTPAQALDVVLCWGWIDGLRKSFDERSFLQRYTPRGRRSRWSQINCEARRAPRRRFPRCFRNFGRGEWI